MRLARLYWKVQADWTWAVPLGALSLLLLIMFKRTELLGMRRRPEDLYVMYEFFFPLLAGLWAAHLPVLERRSGVAEVHLCCPSWPSYRLVVAAAAPALAWLATAAFGVLVTEAWYVDYNWTTMAAVTAAPAVALSGAAVTASSLARHQLAGGALVSFWWLLDLIRPGVFTDRLYLFRVSTPFAAIAPEVHSRNLLLFGASLWLFSLWLSHRRTWWIR